MAGVTGLEPVNTGVKVLCLSQLGDTPIRKGLSLQDSPQSV